MPSLLFVTHINFWKRDLGSRVRLYELIEYLKSSFNITVLYILQPSPEDIQTIEDIRYKDIVEFLNHYDESEINVAEKDTFLDQHPVLNAFYDESKYKKFHTFCQFKSFDYTIIEYIHLSYFLPLLTNQIVLLDSHDIMHIRNQVFQKHNHEHWIEIDEAEEMSILSLYHYVISIQEKEHQYLLKHNIKSILVPYSFSTKNIELREKTNDQKCHIIFMGGNTLANIDALKWFIQKIWRYISSDKLELDIYGSICDASDFSVENMNHLNINFHGFKENLEEIYLYADIVINPVRLGGGLKIKNIEALAYGIPLLTTPQGAAGLEKGINTAFFVANNKDEWIEKIKFLINSPSSRKEISTFAFNFIDKYFNKQKCYNSLITLLQSKSNFSEPVAFKITEDLLIKEKIKSIPFLRKKISTLNEKIEELQLQIKEKNIIINNKETDLIELRKRIVEKNAVINNKEAELVNLRNQLKGKQ